MPSVKPRYSKDEVGNRGEEIYEKIKSQVDTGNQGKVLAIDIETGEFEVDDDPMVAVDRLFARLPDPQVYSMRIGGGGVYRFGGQALRKS